MEIFISQKELLIEKLQKETLQFKETEEIIKQIENLDEAIFKYQIKIIESKFKYKLLRFFNK